MSRAKNSTISPLIDSTRRMTDSSSAFIEGGPCRLLNLERDGGDVVFKLDLERAGLGPRFGQRDLERLNRGGGLGHVHRHSSQILVLLVGKAPLAGLLVDDKLPWLRGHLNENRVVARGHVQTLDVEVGIGVECRRGVRSRAPDRIRRVVADPAPIAKHLAALDRWRAGFYG